ncbi:hypothetical protein GCM10011613_21490 [Cellvibrio zantedeschiae]|uniref:Cytochrome c domain-containing protein n=1 Tax=Cellvibrio zantedeschiae TaxID=1237077 RepID=A0ABQ3B364_9GAMM|nr:Ig-like domain-containing protein [Cellvibrio zantedeschiae]GGY76695.1 hypothetical protein GCM10011613_21490 [Cellvibrio zantedeschiae]
MFPVLVLWSCGGGGSGKAELPADAAPVAVAEVLGASLSGGLVNVRSGSDVVLTGVNSKGIDDPILQYQWQQIDNSGFKVELYERATNTVAFTAPSIPLSNTEGVKLKFRLTITDADGVKATNEIETLVQSIKDSNHFLSVPGVENRIQAYITTQKDDLIASDIPVVLQVDAIAKWPGRDGNNHDAIVMSKRFSGTVPAGKVEAINSSNNLSFSIPLPELNLDEINKQFKGESRLARLEFEHLQEAQIALSIQLQQTGGATLSVYLTDIDGAAVLDVSSVKQKLSENPSNKKMFKPVTVGGAAPVLVDVENLRQALGLESKLSANNYYQCIDPQEKAKTFSGWLASAGFTGKDDGDVNTKYINNYDLGFGRDMHMRKDSSGNIYSYVTNYNTLENTLSNRNEFAIVVMEYSPAPSGVCGDVSAASSDKKIVKFYAYIPDQKNGDYIRAESMNFDGRGEKYLPGVCTACHSGNNHTKEFNSLGKISAENADLESGFMPWDLDAFLYTKAGNARLVDPAYAAFAKSAGIATAEQDKYSRENQEASFKLQNQMVLHTMTENANRILRHAQAIKQLHGWYGDTAERSAVEALNFGGDSKNLPAEDLFALQQKLKTLPGGKFDGSYIPAAWRGDKSQEALYTDVYERNCRMCHLFTPNVKFDFDNYAEFVNHPSLKNYVYERGLMPMSRLTMDRFWLNFNGGDSAAKKLREHLNGDASSANDVSEKLVPGAPVAIILPDANTSAPADVQIDFDETISFDGTTSLFSETYKWMLDDRSAGTARKYNFIAKTPGENHKLSLQVASSDGESPATIRRIAVTDHKPNIADLPTQSVIEGAEVTMNLYLLLCPNAAVDDKACRDVFGDIQKGKTPTILIGDSVKHGVIKNVDVVSGNLTFQSTEAKTAGDAEFTLAIKDSFGDQSEFKKVSVIVNSLAAPTIGGPDTCSLSARTSVNNAQFPVVFNSANCPDPTANDYAAKGLVFKLDSVDPISAKGGTLSVNNGLISYTPPSGYVGTDSFNYRIRDNSFTKKMSEGTVSITVTPKVNFSSISASIDSSCPACHRVNTSALGPNWRLYSTFSSRAGGLGSSFFAYACGDPNHLGGNRLCNSDMGGVSPSSVDQLNGFGQTILTWVEEGGLNN